MLRASGSTYNNDYHRPIYYIHVLLAKKKENNYRYETKTKFPLVKTKIKQNR